MRQKITKVINIKFFTFGLAIFLVVTTAMANIRPTSAASTAGFDPGNIITDYVMSNYNTMSVADINFFLHTKNSCNDTDISKAYYYSSYSYHIENGHFVCMADETFNGKSAAQIIYNAAQTYHINPQVLIVLLQKEQGLVTDTWPNSVQYRSATGYGCPDTAACDTKYYGFENQINNAAAMYRSVLDGGWSNYHVGYNYIQYNPNAYCGGSTVYIQNRATASLYRYTPYQPNASALSAGYGTGDSCGAYGNRNFYLYFTDWFGSTQIGTPSFSPSIYLPDSEFTISTTGGKYLATSGNNIIIADNGARFQFVRTSDGFYNIKETSTGLVASINGNSFTDGSNIELATLNTAECSQKWHLSRDNGSSLYTIKSACSGWSFDVSGGYVSTPGTNLGLYHSNNTAAQRWLIYNNNAVNIPENTKYNLITTTNMALDVSGASTEDKANLQVWNANNTKAQEFVFNRTNEGYYTIRNTNSSKLIDVNGGSSSNGANIHIYHNNNTCAQLWYPVQAGEYYFFRSACSGKVMDIAGGATTKIGTNVNLYHSNSTDAQKWKLVQAVEKPADNNTTKAPQLEDIQYGSVYSISPVDNSNLVLDVDGGSDLDKTNIQLYSKDDNRTQKWQIIQNPDNTATLVNTKSNKTVDLAGGVANDQANINLYHSNGTCAQKWLLSPVDNTGYSITSACDNSYSISYNGNATSGANVGMQKYSGARSQLWTFSLVK